LTVFGIELIPPQRAKQKQRGGGRNTEKRGERGEREREWKGRERGRKYLNDFCIDVYRSI
jgi:hypothetical protein